VDSLSRSGLHVRPISQSFLQRERPVLARCRCHGRRPWRPVTEVLRSRRLPSIATVIASIRRIYGGCVPWRPMLKQVLFGNELPEVGGRTRKCDPAKARLDLRIREGSILGHRLAIVFICQAVSAEIPHSPSAQRPLGNRVAARTRRLPRAGPNRGSVDCRDHLIVLAC
jgi:hypothetical protein